MSVNILSRAGASLGVNWWRLASIVGAIAVFVVIAMAVLQTVYPSLPSSLRFLAYVVLFNLLPGLAVAGFLFTRVRPPGTFLIYALSFGTTANVLVFLPLWMAGVSSWFRAFPVVALCVLVLLWRRLRLPELFTDWVPVRGFAGWLAGAILLCGTPLLTMAYVLADDPVSVHSLHFAFQGVVVRSLETGWPPPNLTVAELTLSYHYAAHLWILAAFQNSGVDLGVLVARYGPLYFPACACAMLFAFSRFVLKLSAPAAALPIVAVFWVVGLPVIYAQIFGSFVPFGSALIMSPAFGFAVFLLALTCIVELRGRGRLGPVVVGMLTFIGTGARGVVGPIVICALALLATVVWRQTGTVRR